jgi:hypothetical protein
MIGPFRKREVKSFSQSKEYPHESGVPLSLGGRFSVVPRHLRLRIIPIWSECYRSAYESSFRD